MQLDGKVILVTGGANGIGAATALACAARGAAVVVADYDDRCGPQVAAQVGGMFVRVDVANEDSVQAMAAAIARRHGGLDGLLHCAGVMGGAGVDLADFNLSTWHRVLDTNALGSFLCAKHAAPLMRAGGVIVLVSSIAAAAVSASLAYGASKAAVTKLGVDLAARLAPKGIRVNVVAPGNIDTAMKRQVLAATGQNVPTVELGDPSGVARVLAWLASDDASYVQGQVTTR
jgi:NAD(P)-dependent dehydrogenase (short-subunit alcohol dehydrogenase family)